MFNELCGQTLSKDQLIEWSIVKGISQMTVEDIIYKALDAKANIINLSKKYMEGINARKLINKSNNKEAPMKKALDKSKMTKMIFTTLEQRDLQLEAFKQGSYVIDKDNPLVVYIKLI